MNLDDLGYEPFFEENRNLLGFSDCKVARVISESRGTYRVKTPEGEYLARITGKQMFNAVSREDYPAVGDWVAIAEADKENAVILAVLPRATVIKRKYGEKTQVIAANVDIAFVVESVDRDYNLNRFERYFALAENGGVKPAIILNKADLLSEEELHDKLAELKNRFPDTDIISTSAAGNKGLDELKRYIVKGKTYCFLGSSGVGKSTLINKFLGEASAGGAIKTGEISAYSERGKHVTTRRQMYFLQNGGIVIDNPGMREVGVADAGAGVENIFSEIKELSRECRYMDCTHTREPGCAVLKAVESGDLDKGKYSNYVALRKEAGYYEMDDVEKRNKDRRFGKFLKKAKKDFEKL